LSKSKARSTPKIRPVKVEKSHVDIETDELLTMAASGDLNQIIYIGRLVEETLKGEFGSVLRALLRGRAAADLSESRIHGCTLSSDRYLGRLDAYERILQDLEQYVLDKDQAAVRLIEAQREQQPAELHHAPDLGERVDSEVVHA